MDQIYLCKEKQCDAKSRFIKDAEEIIDESGQHYKHNCQELNKIRAKFQGFTQLWSENNVDQIKSIICQQSDNLKITCQQIIDEIHKNQENSTLSNFQSQDQLQIEQFVKAILDKDLKFLEENQNFYQMLDDPKRLLEQQGERFTKMNLKILEQSGQVKKNLQEYLIFDLNQNLTVEEQRAQQISSKLEILKKQLNSQEEDLVQKVRVIEDQVQNNKKQVLKIKQLDNENKYLLQKTNADYQNVKRFLQMLTSLHQDSDQIKSLSQKLTQDNLNLKKDFQLIFTSQTFHWSNVNKQNSVKINGQVTMNGSDLHNNSSFLDPQLSFSQVQKIQLKLTKLTSVNNPFIKDLLFDHMQCQKTQNFPSHPRKYSSFRFRNLCTFKRRQQYFFSFQEFFCTDTYGQGTTKNFKFLEGDILELQWNGPLKLFTTFNIQTGEKFEFKTTYQEDDEIHFGVILDKECSYEIV